jgi:toxin ParE1/3/4
MSSYSFSDEAVRDLEEICNYIAQNNPKAASKLFDSIRKKCKVVASFPNMGKRYEKLAPGFEALPLMITSFFIIPEKMELM